MAETVQSPGGAAGAISGLSQFGSAQGGQTRFSIDVDQAPKLVEALTEAVEKLDRAYWGANAVAQVESPGKDLYSAISMVAMRSSANEEVGGYQWANKLAQKALLKNIENIKKAIEQYKNVESEASGALG
ncbi:hypothetical protein, partial [Actinosynnema sp.]|uniref:hypothetical protein n=1 Tax=Actinosynnema sp. TaxID=1872144 RepID=UPI003F84EB68